MERRKASDIIKEKSDKAQRLYEMICTTKANIRASIQASFDANNGCKTCRGRGWIVAWDTMDCMDGSCADFTHCPEQGCTQETRRATGLAPDEMSKYDRIRGTPDVVRAHPSYDILVRTFEDQLTALHNDIRDEQRDPRKGDTVVVVKGRKAPIGTMGRIFWLKDTGYGPRIGIKDTGDNVTWTYLKNVERLV